MGFFHKARNIGKLAATSVAVAATLAVAAPMKQAQASPGTLPDAVADQAQPSLSPALEKAIANEKADGKQFLGLADMDHRHMGINTLTSDGGTIGSLAAHNYKLLFIESAPETQKLINAYAAKEIGKEAFVQGMTDAEVLQFKSNPKDIRKTHEYTADMIRRAAAQGIQVCAVDFDTTLSDPQSPVLRSYRDKAYQAWADAGGGTGDKLKDMESGAFLKFEKGYYDGMPRQDQRTRNKAMLEERFHNDQEIAQTMKNIAGDRKAAIYYGGLHMPGFQKALGAENLAIARLEPESPKAKDATVRGVSAPVLGAPGFARPGA